MSTPISADAFLEWSLGVESLASFPYVIKGSADLLGNEAPPAARYFIEHLIEELSTLRPAADQYQSLLNGVYIRPADMDSGGQIKGIAHNFAIEDAKSFAECLLIPLKPSNAPRIIEDLSNADLNLIESKWPTAKQFIAGYDCTHRELLERRIAWERFRVLERIGKDQPTYLGLAFDFGVLSITGNGQSVDFSRNVKSWSLVCRLLAARDEGRTRNELLAAIYPDTARTPNVLDQHKGKANELLMPLGVEIAADNYGVWRLVEI